ncbi:hypothetical protein A0256_07210 [Mucilaginibacter sp. PAMC 26640]|nr:hypothetical protein A0256_07210 [Mucilaginibacter sp. PAMC 26640]
MKFKKELLYLVFLTTSFLSTVLAQDKKIAKEIYLASNIPDSLKEEANAVVRYSFDEIIVKGPGKAIKKHHSIVTILNEKGDDEAELILSYDKNFNTVNSAEMIVYNAAGLQIKKYKKGDMYDRAAADGMSTIMDYRLLILNHTVASYPATIEVTYETGLNSYLDLGEWNILHPERSVQNAEYTVIADPLVGFRYKNKNTNIKPEKTTEGNLEKYSWKVANLKALKPEDDALNWQVFPKVMFATNQFKFDGIPGDFSTWENYGKWQQILNNDVCTLSPARVAEIQRMTAAISTDKEKAKFLYEYMQQNVRYVSIQLGIGGLKPFPATFVDEKKYGDCKALSNYMYALLKAVNIPSYYAMVRAGVNEEPADAAFPTDPFNHVILCIPFKGDTTWLECTNNNKPFGKLGSFTENRNALLVTETGGKLINTPRSNYSDNQFNSEVHLILNTDGSAKALVKILSTGEYRGDYVSMASLKTDQQKEMLIKTLNMKQPSTLELVPGQDKDGIRELDLNVEYDKFCEVASGSKQFYRPRLFDLWKLTLPTLENRKTDFYFDQPMQKSCTTTIDLPAGFEVETLPVNQSLKFSYGNYEVNYVFDAAKNQIISTAKFNLTTQKVPAGKYTEMQQYMDNIAKAQNKKLVIRKKA